MQSRKIPLVTLVVVVLLLMTQCVGPATTQKTVETVVVTNAVEVTRAVEVTKVVPVTVEVEKIKEVVVTASPAPVESAITIAIPEEPPHLYWSDSQVGSLITGPVALNAYEQLTRRNGRTGALEASLALSWEQVDLNTWRFKLRDGVKFHNGKPLDAALVAWNLNFMTDPANKQLTIQFTGQQLKATEVDEFTVDVWSEKPDPILPLRMAMVNMGEPTAIEADPNRQNMVGTGAYMLDEWAHGEKIVLVANPDYWGGEPPIKKVTFVWRAEPTVRAAMLRAGEAEIAAWLAPQDTGPVRALGVNIAETAFLYMDSNPPLDDLNVRRAICTAIDRDALARQLWGGYATPANGIITPDVVGYNASIPVYPYDPDAAAALLAEAKAAGTPIDKQITIYGRKGIYPNATETMEALTLWLTKIGLNVRLQMLELSAWREINLGIPVPADRVGIIQSSAGNEIGDGILTAQTYFGPYGNANWYKFDDAHGGSRRPVVDPKIVEMIDKAGALTIEEGRGEALAEVFALYNENVLWACPLVHIQDLYGVAERLDWEPRFDRSVLVREMRLK